MRNWIFPLALVTSLLSPATFAEERWRVSGAKAKALDSFDTVDIYLSDSVSGGCMPRPNEVKKAAELQLRRNNFKIGNNDSFRIPEFYISVVGLRATSVGGDDIGCATHIDVSLDIFIEGIPYTDRWTPAESGVYRYSVPLKGTLLVGGDSVQKRLEDHVRGAVDELFLETQRARDYLEKNFPEAVK
jgi:hypothetical protein